MYKVAIMGKANTGKNTLGKMLVRQLRQHNNQEWMSASYMAFADPMKEMIREMFPGLPKKFLYGSSKFRNEIVPRAFKDGAPLTVRQLLIDVGTQGRSYNSEVWVDNFSVRLFRTYRKITVVTDVRFRNEFDYLRKEGFYLIRLYRETGQPEIQHISETGQQAIKDEEFDYVLLNNRPLEKIKLEVSNNIIPYLHDK